MVPVLGKITADRFCNETNGVRSTLLPFTVLESTSLCLPCVEHLILKLEESCKLTYSNHGLVGFDSKPRLFVVSTAAEKIEVHT